MNINGMNATRMNITAMPYAVFKMFERGIIYTGDKRGCSKKAEVPELPGCSSHGKDRKEALEQVDQAMELWLATAREFGDPIPEPKGRKLMYA